MMRPLLLAWLALLAALMGAPAAAQDYPMRPAGPVYDGANIIDVTDERLLDVRLRGYNESTGRAVIVATVPSLDGLEIEPYAQGLAETWDIGGAETQNGLLFLIAPNERRVRIATARGLDVRMTDIMSGRIIRDVVTPRFKAGEMSGGIVAGVDAIIAQLDMDPAQAQAIEEAELARQAQQGSRQGGEAFAGAIIPIVLILLFMFTFGRGRRRQRRYGVAGAIGDVILWNAIGSAMGGSSRGGGGFGGFGGGGGGGGFGGFGGGGGGFSGGGASGGW